MKLTFNLMAAWILFAGTVQAREQPKPDYPFQIAKVLRQDLPNGWTLKSDGSSIVITRDEQLTLMGTINIGFIPSLPIVLLGLRSFFHFENYV